MVSSAPADAVAVAAAAPCVAGHSVAENAAAIRCSSQCAAASEPVVVPGGAAGVFRRTSTGRENLSSACLDRP